ncbi:MAG TPA: hypothetical protein VFL69_02015 [Marmoricola sp.]|jgi:hypothetical protein|nr:hypothetical protein [Marmoricola sp.]
MTLPPDSSFPSPSVVNAVPWWWQLLDAEGRVVEPEEGRQEFPSRSDAESWVGECWAELAEEGVAAVTLFEGDREVYGPMSLELP